MGFTADYSKTKPDFNCAQSDIECYFSLRETDMTNPQNKAEPDEDLARLIMGKGPYTYLLLLLLGLILLFPFLEEGIFARTLLGILFSIVLLVGAFATRQTRRGFILKLGLALLGVGLQWTALWTESIAILGLAGIVYTASLAVSFSGVLLYILKRGPITAGKLHGALAGYIMLAFVWSFVYALVEISSAGSFGPGHLDFAQPGTFFKLIYFSLTTLTTTGYGDIIPLTNHARSLVMVEEFSGVFYVGVVIARFAGLYPSNQAK
ncbi:putative membrane protein [Pseudomonas frederiksbergensis]